MSAYTEPFTHGGDKNPHLFFFQGHFASTTERQRHKTYRKIDRSTRAKWKETLVVGHKEFKGD